MSILPFPTASRPRVAPAPRFAAVADLWSNVVQAWRIRQADHAMHGLSDEMLHDIGVSRSEIETVTRHGRPRR